MFCLFTVTCFGVLYSSCTVCIKCKVYQVEGSAVQAVGTAAGVKIIIVQNCGIILKCDKMLTMLRYWNMEG